MKAKIKKRGHQLILDDEPRLGEADGRDVFRLNWEFWLQLTMFHRKALTNAVTPQQAEKLAQIVDKLPSTESGQIHLHLWGDDDGEASKSLCGFLRRGGFQVVNSAAQGPG